MSRRRRKTVQNPEYVHYEEEEDWGFEAELCLGHGGIGLSQRLSEGCSINADFTGTMAGGISVTYSWEQQDDFRRVSGRPKRQKSPEFHPPQPSPEPQVWKSSCN